MSNYANRAHWVIFLGLTVSLATTALTHAGQPKNKPLDTDAEAKQSADEDAKEAADRAKGIKPQRLFLGMFLLLTDSSQKLSADVVGSFVTDQSDTKPGRTYLVKVANGNKDILAALKRSDVKKVQVTGKLRNIGPDGVPKYLIVTSTIESAPTPRAPERRKLGGL